MDTGVGQGYYPQHGADGDQPEDARDEGYPRQAALGPATSADWRITRGKLRHTYAAQPSVPGRVRQPEADQPPGGDLTSHGLDIHQLAHRDPRADADKPQHHRPQHVPDTAKHGDGQCPEQ